MVAIIIFFLLLILLLSEAGLRPSIIKYLNLMFASIFASIVTFNFYEKAAGVLISKNMIVPWATATSFIALFLVSGGIIWLIADLLVKEELKLPVLVTRTLTLIFAFVFTIVLSGVINSTIALMPMGESYPYSCFPGDEKLTVSNVDTISKNAVPPTDNMIANMFGMVSGGSLKGDNSFYNAHPNFTKENFLNKTELESAGIISGAKPFVVDSDRRKVVGSINTKLRDNSNETVEIDSGSELITVTVSFTKKTIEDGGALDDKRKLNFTLSQLRVICYDKTRGKYSNSFAMGFLDNNKKLIRKNLNELISFESKSFVDNDKLTLTFVYSRPENTEAVAIAFKQNVLVNLPKEKVRNAETNSENGD